MEASPRSNVPTSNGKQQRGYQLHINAHDFGIRFSTNRYPHHLGNAVFVGQEKAWQNITWTPDHASPIQFVFRVGLPKCIQTTYTLHYSFQTL